MIYRLARSVLTDTHYLLEEYIDVISSTSSAYYHFNPRRRSAIASSYNYRVAIEWIILSDGKTLEWLTMILSPQSSLIKDN